MNLKVTSTKSLSKNLKTKLVLAGAVVLTTVVLSSCSKESNNNITQTASSVFAVVNASPNCPSSDFYLNNVMINTTPFTYGNYLGYINGPVGASKFGFYDSGTLTPIATDTLTLKQNQAYTVFFTNLITNPTFVILKDTITAPASNFASVRLVNVSPDAPNVDLAIGNTVYATNIPYKQASKFIAIPAISNDTLKIRQTGTTTVLAKVSAVSIQLGFVYTIWLYGFANPPAAGEGLNANLMENAVFNP
jgi:hypothetical protein